MAESDGQHRALISLTPYVIHLIAAIYLPAAPALTVIT